VVYRGDTIHTFIIFLMFGAGLALIIWGGDRFVDAAVWIAEVSGLPRFLIGATVVSVATTLPEIIVSVMAAADGQPQMAAGNAVGSVTANTALILSLTVIFMPFAVRRRDYAENTAIFLSAVTLLLVLCLRGRLTVFGSAAMMMLFIFYMYRSIRAAKRLSGSAPTSSAAGSGRQLIRFITGAAAIILGSRLLVDYGTLIAREVFHVDERVISLTLVAVGTSLPELVTAVTSVIKRRSSLAAGNILGANIIDILLILPLCTFVSGGSMPLEPEVARLDLPVCLLCAVILFVPALIRRRFYRWQGFAALSVYGLYLWRLICTA